MVMSVYCEKKANSTEMLFVVVGRVGPGRQLYGGLYWRHLANTVERKCARRL